MKSLKEEFFACLALRHTPGLGPKTWAKLLRHYDSAFDALKNASVWYESGFAPQRCADAAKAEQWRKEAEKEYLQAMRLGFGLLPWSHPSFPTLLKEIPDPPVYLYYFGDPVLLKNPAVAIVGSRTCSNPGLEATREIAGDLSRKGITIVSGFARGIDSCAHEEALKEIGSSIAVLGTGLDVDNYPPGSESLRNSMIEKGLIISEFAPGTKPYGGNFPFRNRIISGLSVGVLVTGADKTSGSLITARLAGEQGRDVMALPGPPGDSSCSGCLKLIKEGAALVESADDILMNIGHALNVDWGKKSERCAVYPESKKKVLCKEYSQKKNNVTSPVQSVKNTVNLDLLDQQERDIALLLEREGKLHIDEIARSAKVDVSLAGAVVLGMEIKGVVVRFPGMYYDLNRC